MLSYSCGLIGHAEQVHIVYEPFVTESACLESAAGSNEPVVERGEPIPGSHAPPLTYVVLVVDTIYDVGASEASECKRCAKAELQELTDQLSSLFSTRMNNIRVAIVTLEPKGFVRLHGKGGRSALFPGATPKFPLWRSSRSDFSQLQRGRGAEDWWWISSHTECCQVFNSLNANLHVNTTKRAQRSTGLALELSVLISKPHTHIVAFLNGPCTEGPGKIISTKRSKPISRANNSQDKCYSFYKELLQKRSHAVYFNFFVNSLDQIGLMQMSSLILYSQVVQQYDSFARNGSFTHVHQSGDQGHLRATLKEFFQRVLHDQVYDVHLNIESNSSFLNVLTPYINLKTQHAKQLHIDFDNAFVVGNKDSQCVIFTVPKGEIELKLQFQYIDNNQKHTQETTVHIQPCRMQTNVIIFTLMKQIVLKLFEDPKSSMSLNKLDELAKKFNKLFKDSEDLILYLYFLRRSPLFLLRDTISPDQLLMFMNQVMTANCEVCLKLCRPQVFEFVDEKPTLCPPLITEKLLENDRVMCMDAGNLVVLRGHGVSKNEPGFKHAVEFVESIRVSRFPQPIVFFAEPGSSQDRCFRSKLAPTGKNNDVHDISFEQFRQKIAAK